MPYLERKQRDLQRRVDLILRVGRELLLKSGYRGLTMTRIAELTEYSKGTIYQHFSCKEEVVLHLAAESIDCLLSLLRRVEGQKCNAMLKMALIAEAYILFYRLYPLEFSLLSTIRSKSLRERINLQQYEELEALEQSVLNIITDIVSDGVKQGELALNGGEKPEELSSGAWFMLYGAFALHEGKTEKPEETNEYFQLVRKNFQYYVFCWPWTAKVMQHICNKKELNIQLEIMKMTLFESELESFSR